MADPAPAPVRRGSRPRNRREQILTAATELFVERGYAQVGMGDLAEAVGIGPSALYRHFAGKHDVLAKVVTGGLAPLHEVVLELDPGNPAAAKALASCALEHRQIGLIWHREARNLTPDVYQPLKDAVQETGQGLTNYVRAVQPGISASSAALLAWSSLSVLTSPSFHHLDVPRPAFEELLAEMVVTVVTTDLPEPVAGPPTGAAAGLRPASRREELLTQAMRMFADHGYAQVGIEDVGRAVGIAGPSVYNHWSSKRDLLSTLLRRGAASLALDVTSAYLLATDPADALRRLVHSYVALTHAHPEVFSLLITDIDHLPAEERHAIRQAQHDYVGEWAHLLRLHQPHLEPVPARIRVHTVLSVIHDIGRNPYLRSERSSSSVVRIANRLLELPDIRTP